MFRVENYLKMLDVKERGKLVRSSWKRMQGPQSRLPSTNPLILSTNILLITGSMAYQCPASCTEQGERNKYGI